MKYKYTAPEPMRYETGYHIGRHLKFKDTAGNAWLDIEEDGTTIVAKGYSCDGCSPKLKLKGPVSKNLYGVIGTYDGPIDPQTDLPITAPAFFLHDALYQFKDEPHMPFSRQQMDLFFLNELVDAEFKYAPEYYYAVARFGGIYHGITKPFKR